MFKPIPLNPAQQSDAPRHMLKHDGYFVSGAKAHFFLNWSTLQHLNRYLKAIVFMIILLLVGCTPELPNAVDITPVTAIPTMANGSLCAIGQDESGDWDTRINALIEVYERSANCETDINLLLYDAYVGLGRSLENDGDVDGAIIAYETARIYVPDETEAQRRITELRNSKSSEEIASCEDIETPEPVESYQASDQEFAVLDETGFQINDVDYPIYGVNYYPLNTPFGLFLTETELEDVEAEFELIREAGINTLRIFLRPQDLFVCDADIPHAENFERLDAIIQLALDYDMRLIMVLNQDVIPRILYHEDFILGQMRFIVARYREEGAILAWDVRDRADVDYRTGLIRQDNALGWLADAVVMIRQIDSQHPITIGFWQDALVTAPFVDFVSFQFYGEYADLRQEIANLRSGANRPILLSAIGYSTFTVSDVTQRNLLFQAFEEVEHNDLMGWMLNHAFDYPRTVTCIPPDCPGDGSELNQYGLWNTSYFPKLAVEAVRIATGVDE